MGNVRPPKKVQLVMGLISADTGLFDRTKKYLEKMFGPIDFESAVMDFDHTEYYREEFGIGLKRIFFGFRKIFSLDNLYTVKIKTNMLERRFLQNGKRAVNIDPGCLDMSKLVLFSTKDYSHRIYAGKGIYAEVTLFYKDKRFNAWPWTYPDYKTESYIKIFDSIRELYRKKIGLV